MNRHDKNKILRKFVKSMGNQIVINGIYKTHKPKVIDYDDKNQLVLIKNTGTTKRISYGKEIFRKKRIVYLCEYNDIGKIIWFKKLSGNIQNIKQAIDHITPDCIKQRNIYKMFSSGYFFVKNIDTNKTMSPPTSIWYYLHKRELFRYVFVTRSVVKCIESK